MPDHIHLFISAPPFEAPTNIVLKGVTAKRLFEKFPELRKKEFGEDTYGRQATMFVQQDMFRQKQLKKYIKGVESWQKPQFIHG